MYPIMKILSYRGPKYHANIVLWGLRLFPLLVVFPLRLLAFDFSALFFTSARRRFDVCLAESSGFQSLLTGKTGRHQRHACCLWDEGRPFGRLGEQVYSGTVFRCAVSEHNVYSSNNMQECLFQACLLAKLLKYTAPPPPSACSFLSLIKHVFDRLQGWKLPLFIWSHPLGTWLLTHCDWPEKAKPAEKLELDR